MLITKLPIKLKIFTTVWITLLKEKLRHNHQCCSIYTFCSDFHPFECNVLVKRPTYMKPILGNRSKINNTKKNENRKRNIKKRVEIVVTEYTFFLGVGTGV